MATTLKELLEQHPEWANLPMVVYNGMNGEYDWVGASGSVYLGEETEDGKKIKVLVFAGN
jgi:hypothetical protein